MGKVMSQSHRTIDRCRGAQKGPTCFHTPLLYIFFTLTSKGCVNNYQQFNLLKE